MSEPDLPELDRWLYVGTTLIKVTPGSTGPDVFCKLLDAEAAIATERARADALEAALREVLLAQENYARCHAREVNAINNYSGGQAEYSSATLKATVRVSEAERAARALLEKKT